VYRPYGGCLRAWQSRDKEVLLAGPAGTGKSRAILEKLHYLADTFECRILIARQTRASITDTTLVTFEDHVVPFGHECLSQASRENRHSYRYPSGAEIVIGGFDQPTRMLSSEYDIVYIPEATEVNKKAWETVLTRLRNNKLPVHQLIADCNPDSPSHWLYQRCLSGSTRLIETHHEDNPTLYDQDLKRWTAKGIDYLSTLDALTGAEKERLRYGRWVQAPGAIYGMFDPAKHITDVYVDPKWPVWIGMDFGEVHTAAVFLSERPDGVFVCWGSYLNGNVTNEEHNRVLRQKLGTSNLVMTVGGSWSEQEIRNDFALAGLPIAKPPIREVEVGIKRVVNALLRGRLIFTGGAQKVTEEMSAYSRVLDPGGEATHIIKDKNKFHRLDALRYIVSMVNPGENDSIVQSSRFDKGPKFRPTETRDHPEGFYEERA
jgi:PBSX family phage terminase large subunit